MIAIDTRAKEPASRRDGFFTHPLRIVLTDVLRLVYRLRATGLDHVPAEGAAIIAHNHVSVIDWLLIAISCPRVPRFVMHVGDYDRPVLKWIFDAFGAIPIATQKEDPALLARAYEAIDEALAAGDLVAICPEGKMTPDGDLKPFKDGITRILRRRPAAVVPVGLSGMWGSFFSRKNGPPLTKLPRAYRADVRITVGRPMPGGGLTKKQLFERIATLRGPRR